MAGFLAVSRSWISARCFDLTGFLSMPALYLDDDWIIPGDDLELSFVRSSGPGGQNVNKLATKAELRFKFAYTRALLPAQKRRLVQAFPSHATREGDFVVTADSFRSQARNQQDALQRLASMILSIRHPPKPRLKTRPSAASKRKRLEEKRRRAEVKRRRRGGINDR